MKPSTYLVMYRDSEGAKVRYFGPFVNQSIASEFVSALPDPQSGGFKQVTITQPYTSNEAELVKDVILRHRVN